MAVDVNSEAVPVGLFAAALAGIPYVPEIVGDEQLRDWDAMCHVIENLTPSFPPGSRQFYHAHTLSWILGELIHRVDGRAYHQPNPKSKPSGNGAGA